jgi:hypothetical protein
VAAIGLRACVTARSGGIDFLAGVVEKIKIVSLSPEGRNANCLPPPKTPLGLGERPLHFKHSPLQHLIFETAVVISLVMAALCGTSALYMDGSARGIPIDKKS